VTEDQGQLRWVAAGEPVALYAAPTVRAPTSVLAAGRPMVQVAAPQGWVELRDLISDLHGWVRAGNVGGADTPEWAKALDAIRAVEMPARVFTYRSDWKFNSQLQLVASGTGDDGATWYVSDQGELIPDGVLRTPVKPAKYYPGKWIDADLTEPVMVTAYEDDRPVYTAFAVKGTAANPTRVGVWPILRRVANETMDSTTLGCPRGCPGFYHLTGVLWTQYFTGDGASIHYNYWRANWGYAGSHGCLGMNLTDSKFFWDWASIGVPVVVHY
jgi:hypothetical protein